MALRRPLSPIPPGWHECPPIGNVCKDYPLIPMKVPLGPSQRVPNMYDYTNGAWNPEAALLAAHEMVSQRGGVIHMVLDLTNSNKYYDPREFTDRSVRWVKVPCRGRGESPEPLAVNMAVWEIRKTLITPNAYILVHCTHGFNRSGFIIISAAMRLLAEQGWCVERLLRRFKEQRAPGIYKHEYITDLFKRHNEHRPKVVLTPSLPAWKPEDDPDEDEQQQQPRQLPQPQGVVKMTHSDKVGDPVCLDEARWVLNIVYDALAGQDLWMRSAGSTTFPHASVQGKPPSASVIGSQPVSLDRENIALLRQKRYWVTWKADGTRYMMLLLKYGAYLIDRAGEVRRAQMRFPSRKPSSERKSGTYPLGPPHDFTLLDGEMVVDEVDMESTKQKRRFLIYDIMMVGGEGVADLRFADRYGLIGKEVVDARKEEMIHMQRHPLPTFLYDWEWEPFGVRRKEFWPLDKGSSLFDKFIPQLCHESDGVILQPYDDPYIIRTYPHLLKWKFPHTNSVDFMLDAKPGRPPVLLLNCGHRRKFGGSEVNHMSLSACGLGDQRVEFPMGEDPLLYDGKIIECTFDMERRVWQYMRVRSDKDTANHRSVFDKVMTSITDNITADDLLRVFDEALQLDIYKEEQMWLSGTHPSQLAQQQRQLQQKPQQLVQPQQQQQQQQLAPGAAAGAAGAAAAAAGGQQHGSHSDLHVLDTGQEASMVKQEYADTDMADAGGVAAEDGAEHGDLVIEDLQDDLQEGGEGEEQEEEEEYVVGEGF